AALFEIPKRIGHRLAVAGGDQYAVDATLDRALVRRLAWKHAVHHAGAARVRQEFAMIADQSARRRDEDDARLACAGRPHILHLALALGDLVDDDAGVGIIDIDGDFFHRLEPLALRACLIENAGPADGNL